MANYSNFFKNEKLKKKEKGWSEEDSSKFREGFTKTKESPMKPEEKEEDSGMFKKLKKKFLNY
jgi:hypothetical protein